MFNKRGKRYDCFDMKTKIKLEYNTLPKSAQNQNHFYFFTELSEETSTLTI